MCMCVACVTVCDVYFCVRCLHVSFFACGVCVCVMCGSVCDVYVCGVCVTCGSMCGVCMYLCVVLVSVCMCQSMGLTTGPGG